FPPDALTLLAQKRELHAQLEREEMEKHELLAQINALVGEIAQLRANANEMEEAGELSTELEQLKRDFAKKEAELQRTKAEGEEAQRRQRMDRLERERVEEELRERDELLQELTETTTN
uniref:Myosin_tail_1 domain-containing protein n=1 Tax=Globodera pallida TaxID=36090 RepID=A0A183CNS2_GLOPA